jgi:hypothetical protein
VRRQFEFELELGGRRAFLRRQVARRGGAGRGARLRIGFGSCGTADTNRNNFGLKTQVFAVLLLRCLLCIERVGTEYCAVTLQSEFISSEIVEGTNAERNGAITPECMGFVKEREVQK